MFERYTEKARRVIFLARYEASQFGSPYIESEHLLLGLLREHKALAYRFLRSEKSFDDIRELIAKHTSVRDKTSTSVDLPLSNECKRILAHAAEEAERMAHTHIGPEHLLLGILREETSFAARLLQDRGLRLAALRKEIAQLPAEGMDPVKPSVPFPQIELIAEGAVIANPTFQVFAIPRAGDVFLFAATSYRVIEVRFVYGETSSRVEKIQIIAEPEAAKP